MKKLNLKSIMKLSSVLCGTMILSAVMLYTTACQKDEYDDTRKWETAQYLDISSEAVSSPMGEWSVADRNTFSLAFKRITIRKGADGFLYQEEKSPRELNISPALFSVFQKIIDNTNSLIKQKAEERLKNDISLLKTRGEFDHLNNMNSDCVARTISFAAGHFGTDLSHEDLNKTFEEKYGEGMGVPAQNFKKEIKQYLSGYAVNISFLSATYTYSSSATEVYLVSANMTNFGGHAAILQEVQGDWLVLHDPQTGGKVMAHKDEVLEIFKATGVRTE